MPALSVIDVAPLVTGKGDQAAVALQIDRACRADGFFVITGHGVDEAAMRRLEQLSHEFFALPDDEKALVAMAHGGRAWRGWFPTGGELTAGRPDRKEGYYFGEDLGADDPRVAAGLPLHGPNLFPAEPPELRAAVLHHLAAMTNLAHALARGLGLALGLDAGWFDRHLTAHPTLLFRIFHYPPTPVADDTGWGVAEHTDYGLLTILRQDQVGGLEVRTPAGWIEVEPTPGTLVCNLGDMLDRMTGGRYRSTPHRVRAPADADRLSFPFFFDPGWDAEVRPIPLDDPLPPDDASTRWDGTSLRTLEGTYGEYLLAKVVKVFPELGADALDPPLPGQTDTST